MRKEMKQLAGLLRAARFLIRHGIVSMSIVAMCISIPHSSVAQWEKIGVLPPFVVDLCSLYGGKVLIAGTDSGVFRSVDSGRSWMKFPGFLRAGFLAFKSDSVGWIVVDTGYWSSQRININYSFILRTTNAGSTWTQLLAPEMPLHISYQKEAGKLFYSSWGLAPHDINHAFTSFSTNDGDDWQRSTTSGNGIIFSNNHHIVVGAVGIDDEVSVSNDGGLTWRFVWTSGGESHQPVAIPFSDSIVALGDASTSNFVAYSTDGGYSWFRSLFGKHEFTGDANWCNCGSVILGQTSKSDSGGILYSTDLGSTWVSIGGPLGQNDTRFFNDNDWIYCTSPEGEVWRRKILRKPVIAYPARLNGCNGVDTSIRVSIANTCFGIPMSLDSITTTGSQNFKVQPLLLPNTFASEESIAMHYAPQFGSHDTATIHLWFNQHGDKKDTILTIIGDGANPSERVKLICTLTQAHAKAGSIIIVKIYPDRAIVNPGLNTLKFSLSYDGNVLNFSGSTTASVATPLKSGMETVLPITITPAGTSLDPSQPIASLSFKGLLSETQQTIIRIQDIIANPDDPTYQACKLGFDVDTSDFLVDLDCADSALLHYMESRAVPFEVTTITPEPSKDYVSVHLIQNLTGPITYELVDQLGRPLQNGPDIRQVVLNVSNLTSGVYFLRLSESGFVQTKRLLVQR